MNERQRLEMHFEGGRLISLLLLCLSCLAFLNCTSLRYAGVSRIPTYKIYSSDVPASAEGYRMAFATDFHLPSLFRERQLRGTVRALKDIHPDVILLGGDYQEGCEYVVPLFEALSECMPRDGMYAVLGNNDYERCTDEIRSAMHRFGIHLLEYAVDTIRPGIVILGAPFCTHPPLVEPLVKSLADSLFCVFITHSPDIVESAAILPSHVDLAIAGHTHGGQITFFYVIAPETGSRYGRRFLYGKNYTSRGVPVITSRGLGTSRMPIRFCAPTDITVVELHRPK
ncbi:MAG: metallophosphoesterase [Bacteroidaceae bacterium]|nr:metallophosphoesterase [Bacteroidaceae bacterium]